MTARHAFGGQESRRGRVATMSQMDNGRNQSNGRLNEHLNKLEFQADSQRAEVAAALRPAIELSGISARHKNTIKPSREIAPKCFFPKAQLC